MNAGPCTPAAVPSWRPRMLTHRVWVHLGEGGANRIPSRGVHAGTFVHVRQCTNNGVRRSCLAGAVDGAIIILGERMSLVEVEWSECT